MDFTEGKYKMKRIKIKRKGSKIIPLTQCKSNIIPLTIRGSKILPMTVEGYEIEEVEDGTDNGKDKMYICNDCGAELLEPYCIDCESSNVEEQDRGSAKSDGGKA